MPSLLSDMETLITFGCLWILFYHLLHNSGKILDKLSLSAGESDLGSVLESSKLKEVSNFLCVFTLIHPFNS